MAQVSVPVSVGELVDKITILRIKREKIQIEEKRTNILKELGSLEAICEEKNIDLNHEHVSSLQEINYQLWQIEDDIREKESKKEFDQEFIDLARSVYVTNDRRFVVKSKINEFNGSDFKEEKSYESY